MPSLSSYGNQQAELMHRYGGRVKVQSELALPLNAGDTFLLEGSGTVNRITLAPPLSVVLLRIKDAPTFTHSANLICPRSTSYVAAAGDLVFAVSEGDGIWRLAPVPAASAPGGTLSPTLGGTGVANNAASTLTISGSFGTTFTVTGATTVTFPTSGTLAALGGTNTWTGVNTFSNSTPSTTSGNGAVVISAGGLGVAGAGNFGGALSGSSLVATATLDTAAAVDTSATAYSIASGATIAIALNSAGLLIGTENSSGSTGVIAIGGIATAVIGQSSGSNWVASSSPSSSQIGVYWDGASNYRIKNGYATTRLVYLCFIKTRPAA